MKRFLIIAFVVMLVVTMLAVPAFADSTYTAYLEHGILVLPEEPSSGTYRLSFGFASDDGVTDTVVIENVKLMQIQSDYDCFMVAEFILSEPGEDDIPLYLVILHDSADYDSQFPNWHPVAVKIQDDGGNMLPLASLSLERVTEPVSGEEAAVDSVFGVFTGIGSWLIAELGNATSLFYQADTGLTILGVLAVAGLGIAVVFLLINWVKSLLQFRK